MFRPALLFGACASLAACTSAGVSVEGSGAVGSLTAGTPAAMMPYVLDGVLHDGSRQVKLPTADVVRFATLEGGGAILGVRGGQVPNTSLIVDGKGHVERTLLDVGWVVSTDRSRILTGDGKRVAVLDTSGQEVATRADSGLPVAMVGTVAYTGDDAYAPESRPSTAWDTRDSSTRQLPSKLALVSADGRVAVSVTPDVTPGSTCHQVFALTADQSSPLRKVCGRQDGMAFVPEGASPDGKYLVGHNDAINSAAPVVVVVSTADGSVVVGRPDDEELHGWGASIGPGDVLRFSRSTPDGNRLESCSLATVCAPLTSTLPNDMGAPRYLPAVP